MKFTGWRRWAGLLIFVVIAGNLAAWYLRPSVPPSQATRRFTIYPETAFEVEALWHHALALSPDGSNLAYVEEGRDGRRKIYLRALDEFSATPLPGTEGAISPFFSPDGKELLLTWSDPNHPIWDGDLWILTLGDNDRTLRPFIQRNHNQRHGAWSPDGKWIAYAADESGRWEVYIEPYPATGAKTMISTDGGHQPLWSRDGKELFYRSGDKMMAAVVRTEPELDVTEITELFDRRFLQISYRSYDVTSDGTFLMIQEPQEPAPLGINVVLNWFEELKRPAGPER